MESRFYIFTPVKIGVQAVGAIRESSLLAPGLRAEHHAVHGFRQNDGEKAQGLQANSFFWLRRRCTVVYDSKNTI